MEKKFLKEYKTKKLHIYITEAPTAKNRFSYTLKEFDSNGSCIHYSGSPPLTIEQAEKRYYNSIIEYGKFDSYYVCISSSSCSYSTNNQEQVF